MTWVQSPPWEAARAKRVGGAEAGGDSAGGARRRGSKENAGRYSNVTGLGICPHDLGAIPSLGLAGAEARGTSSVRCGMREAVDPRGGNEAEQTGVDSGREAGES